MITEEDYFKQLLEQTQESILNYNYQVKNVNHTHNLKGIILVNKELASLLVKETNLAEDVYLKLLYTINFNLNTIGKDNLDSIINLLIEKNHDYGSSYANVANQAGWNASFAIRVLDKINRLDNLQEEETNLVKDETVNDTINDLIGYEILLLSHYVEVKLEKEQSLSKTKIALLNKLNDEMYHLTQKIDKLDKKLDEENFHNEVSSEMYDLMNSQYYIMIDYQTILQKRINLLEQQ